MFVQNFIKLSAAVRELSWTRGKNSAENKQYCRRYRGQCRDAKQGPSPAEVTRQNPISQNLASVCIQSRAMLGGLSVELKTSDRTGIVQGTDESRQD